MLTADHIQGTMRGVILPEESGAGKQGPYRNFGILMDLAKGANPE